MLNRLFSLIKDSTKNSTMVAVDSFSHTKISSYFILASILVTTITYLVIDITNAIIIWQTGSTYVIPLEHISILALVMSHHLVLLRLKNASEKTKLMSDKFTLVQDSVSAEDENKKTED
jgi:ABC-type Fe3+-siderophore transport system permease subunit